MWVTLQQRQILLGFLEKKKKNDLYFCIGNAIIIYKEKRFGKVAGAAYAKKEKFLWPKLQRIR